ncbi:hypothetical protein KBY96_12245 [Cyanobium sp. ATX 6A2]|uniref:hypothetical protein n=1 Tax=Cyanobium sp. ATX 6A2 TaxID=2823700 RepID=UPI0020CC960F|nr:hypothetical protein [Cyanobium sp. ATX 6A2]MCP9888692.1 hypothetical protein [Cyanobium sp. ATX 6A2]
MKYIGRYACSTSTSRILPGLSEKYPTLSYLKEDISGEPASALMYEKLLDCKPCLIAKIGSNELGCVATYISVLRRRNFYDYVGQRYLRFCHRRFWRLDWNHDLAYRMEYQAGFFSSATSNLELCAALHVNAIKDVDIYGSWRHEEGYFPHLFRNATIVPLNDLAPFRHLNPWSSALQGQKVLVVHPFSESILRNYRERREVLWDHPDILPDMDLKVVKSIQTSGGAFRPHQDWISCLRTMEDKIARTDFEVAIIGAGAYSLPLGMHVKRLGKKAVVLGGLTQIMFGVWGSRWDTDSDLVKRKNRWWTRPLPSERPPRVDLVENACYW